MDFRLTRLTACSHALQRHFLWLLVLAYVLAAFAPAAGFGAARAAGAGPAQKAALVFGTGMANNGAGLSLAASALAGCPMAVLLVVMVNLVQHLAAGLANRRLQPAIGT